MSSRPASNDSAAVQLFPFLAVLLCTMGALLVLLVVFGQRARDAAIAKRDAKPHSAAAPAAPPTTPAGAVSATDAETVLAELQRKQAEVERVRRLAAQRLVDERARVAGIEDHERRLEHELAQLQVTLQRLEEAEANQSVDQQSAEAQLQRLKEIIQETEVQIKLLQEEPRSKKSYAIVPYKGASGTLRRPIYIECTKDGVIIQPEGIRLTETDFEGPLRSGNPLASALRAAREELNGRAAAAGETDLPDPYPLIIVRPDGSEYYAAALMAVAHWDADYGYEFAEADWQLEFPPQDPRLSQVMEHAVSLARERQAVLARVAPRRYGPRPGGEGGGSGVGGTTAGRMELSVDGGERAGSASPSGSSFFGSVGSHDAGANSTTFFEAAGGPPRYGEIGGDGASGSDGNSVLHGGYVAQVPLQSAVDDGSGANSQGANELRGTGAEQTDGEGSSQMAGGVPGGPASTGSTDPAAAGGPGGSSAVASSATQQAGGMTSATASGAAANSGGNIGSTAPAVAVNHGKEDKAPSAAETRGSNWANAAASQRSSPITRPIHVLVKPEELDMLPERGAAAEPNSISFHQPTDKVLDDLAAALQERIKDWGLAGANMYWRPTLVLEIAPGAERHAVRLSQLLEDSGVDVRLQQVASRPTENATHAR